MSRGIVGSPSLEAFKWVGVWMERGALEGSSVILGVQSLGLRRPPLCCVPGSCLLGSRPAQPPVMHPCTDGPRFVLSPAPSKQDCGVLGTRRSASPALESRDAAQRGLAGSRAGRGPIRSHPLYRSADTSSEQGGEGRTVEMNRGKPGLLAASVSLSRGSR